MAPLPQHNSDQFSIQNDLLYNTVYDSTKDLENRTDSLM